MAYRNIKDIHTYSFSTGIIDISQLYNWVKDRSIAYDTDHVSIWIRDESIRYIENLIYRIPTTPIVFVPTRDDVLHYIHGHEKVDAIMSFCNNMIPAFGCYMRPGWKHVVDHFAIDEDEFIPRAVGRILIETKTLVGYYFEDESTKDEIALISDRLSK